MAGIGREPNVLHSNSASLPATKIGVSWVIRTSVGFTVVVDVENHHRHNSKCEYEWNGTMN